MANETVQSDWYENNPKAAAYIRNKQDFITAEDVFSTSQNGTVPKPTAQEVSDNKVLRADGAWVAQSGGGGNVSDVTVNGTSVVDQNGVAVVTDTQVAQTPIDTTSNAGWSVLLAGSTNKTTQTIEGATKSNLLFYNPSSTRLHVPKITDLTEVNGNGNPQFTDHYTTAYCETADDQAAKEAECSTYKLKSNGEYIPVLMRYANTAQSALTLSIHGTTAKPIYINGIASSATNYTLPAGSYMVYFDGNNYYFRTDNKMPANIDGDAATVNGKTVAENVPSGAVFTDQNVSQTNVSDNTDYEILFASDQDETAGAKKQSNLRYNPYSRTLRTVRLNQPLSLSGIAGSDNGNTHYPAKWSINLGASLPVDGDMVVVKVPSVGGHNNGVYLSLDSNNTYYPIALNDSEKLKLQFAAGGYIELIYEASRTMSAYPVNGGKNETSVTGCFKVLNYAANDIKIGTYSGTTNSNGNLSLADYKGVKVIGATVSRTSTYVCIGFNTGIENMLCFRNTNTNASIGSGVDVSGYVIYIE